MIDVLCVTTKLGFGGVQNFLITLAEPLLKEGIRLNFAVQTRETQKFDSYVENLGCKIFRITPLGESKIRFMKDIRKVLRNNPQIQIIHSHQNFANAYSLLAASGLVKRISHSHSQYEASSIWNRLIKFLFKCFLPLLAEKYWGCSEKSNRWLYGRRAKSKNCLVIKNTIDCRKFKFNAERRKVIRNELHIGDEKIWIHIGTFSHAKNHEFLLKMFGQSLQQNPNQRLILCGDGLERENIEQQIKELGIGNKVIMPGNVSNTYDYLSAADRFVFPSLYEGFPISVVEAQANGIPCIVSTAVPESCAINPNVIRVDNLDISQWLDGIARTDKMTMKREEGVVNIANAGFSIDVEAPLLAKAYKELIKT